MSEFPFAIITGATRGLGKAITRNLVLRGVSCIAIGSSIESIEKRVKPEELLTVGQQQHRSIALDLSRWSQDFSEEVMTIDYKASIEPQKRKRTLAEALEYRGDRYRLRMLVNCAGITQESLTLRTSQKHISTIMNVNFMSPVGLCNYVSKRQLKKRRDSKRVDIVNISSILGATSQQGDILLPGTAVYSASKAALSRFTEVYAKEVEPLGIFCHTIAPGLIPETDMIQSLPETAKKNLLNAIGSNTSTIEEICNQVMDIYDMNTSR
ncbi:3-oxoacyl-[acyl-carrier-protein] reductase (NADPH) [Nakaseomyces bracarensis]|uniref:3-oxoacyl-[acyl-carrier-protein] reductase (NADPH) n=1 Tax=Nakaseomyces bracarensis TaxID=273131 RepID=UPI003871E26C